MRAGFILFAFSLAGCRGSFEFPAGPVAGAQQQVVVVPPNDEVVVPAAGGGVAEVIPPQAECFQRARNFNGLVQRPCADVGRETR